MRNERRWRVVALLSTGMVVGIVLAGSPAGAHVGGTVDHLWSHLQPKADKRYLPGDNLPHGKTMRGAYMLGDNVASGGQLTTDGYTFPQQLASAPKTHFIPAFTVPPAACPGSVAVPRARPGHLCVYEASNTNVAELTIADPVDNDGDAASRWGFFIELRAAGAGTYYSNGTWAATAPS